MCTVVFTQNLRRHIKLERCEAEGDTLAKVLTSVFSRYPQIRGYLLDDAGAVRKHMAILVDGSPIVDRVALSDRVAADARVFVVQALSGG